MVESVADLLSKLPRFTTVITGDDGHLYGIQTSQVAVTTSSAPLLATNNNRVSWTMTNFGSATAFVSWQSAALSNRDFPILANGGVLETSQIDDKNIARMAMSVIGVAATTIAIIEVILIS